MNELDRDTCPKCGAYGTIVHMGRCCAVRKQMADDEAFERLPKMEQRRITRDADKAPK